MLIKVIKHNLGLLTTFQLDDDAHAVAVAVVEDVGDALDTLFIDHRGDLLEQFRFVDLVRNLGDHDLLAILAHALDGGLGAQFQLAAALGVCVVDAVATEDVAAGREIGAGHHLEDLRERRVGMLDQLDGGTDDFRQVVRRKVGRHADGDAGRSINQQVGNARGKDFGFNFAIVVIRFEIDGLKVEVFEQRGGDARKAGFGVPVGRGRVAIHRSEVPLALDQRVAQGEGLGEPDEGVVDSQVAVRDGTCP